jgi:hypothetical protein
MALIDNQVPVPPTASKGYRPRVVVKLKADAQLPHREMGAAASAHPGLDWDNLVKANPGLTLKPYFESLAEPQLRAMEAGGARGPASRFRSYVAVECPPGSNPAELAKRIGGWKAVEIAYVEGGPTPPPVAPGDDPREPSQGFHGPAPAGIDARYAWGRGLDGSGVGFVDLEQGWTLNHEDLTGAAITLISGQNMAYHGHGTAVLGEVVGVDNAVGGVGIAPVASTRVVSQWRTPTSYNTADAILSAAAAMSAGDVLLLEAQTTYAGASGYVPVEVEEATFDAIAYATSLGIVVVEAGGNGSVDLDAFQDVNGKKVLNRSSADFRDSGAILVGAGSAAAPHSRLWFSNYGSRVDCYAWGEQIDTTGDGWTGTLTDSYTTSFGGTSGASPIVTGAALIMQAYAQGRAQPVYTPGALRTLLSDAALNTPSANPTSDRIGVMPNLRKIIRSFEPQIELDRRLWAAVLLILFGVTQDGGGVVIKPGSGPTPIDPWGPLSREQAEVMVGMAVTQLATLVRTEASRRELKDTGIAVMRRAVEKIGR